MVGLALPRAIRWCRAGRITPSLLYSFRCLSDIPAPCRPERIPQRGCIVACAVELSANPHPVVIAPVALLGWSQGMVRFVPAIQDNSVHVSWKYHYQTPKRLRFNVIFDPGIELRGPSEWLLIGNHYLASLPDNFNFLENQDLCPYKELHERRMRRMSCNIPVISSIRA